MHRRITGKLVIATHNPGKLAEMRELLAPHGVEAISAGELGLGEPDETGDSFSANAALKALAAAREAKLPALGDDSGLEIDALNGAPGIYTARWAGPKKDFSGMMLRINDMLSKGNVRHLSRRASFTCAACVAWPDGLQISTQKSIAGYIATAPAGMAGFGFDAYFYLPEHQKTLAELDLATKLRNTPRYLAISELFSL